MSYHNTPTNDANNRLNLENKVLSTIKRTCHRSFCDICHINKSLTFFLGTTGTTVSTCIL